MSLVVRAAACLAPLALASCTSIRPADSAVSATASVNYASQYWFRGTPQSDASVAQGSFGVAVPVTDGTVNLSAWGNMQLSNDSGDAVIRDGIGGEVAEVDLVGNYATQMGGFDVATGVISYNFPNAVGPSTHEIYVSAAREFAGLKNTFSLYYDFDLLDGIYANYAVAKSFSLAEKTSLDVSGMLGYMGSAQSEFYFGHRKSGLSDASLTAGVSYAFDDNTTLFVSGTAVTVPDSDLGDSLDALGFDDSGFYFAVGASWSL